MILVIDLDGGGIFIANLDETHALAPNVTDA
jgi:hypothetical protein